MLFSQKILLVLAACLGLIFFLPNKVNASLIEDEAINLMNSERQKQNLPSLTYSDKLYKASLSHNNLMAECAKKYGSSACFTHTVTQLNEKTLLNRIKDTGYNAQAVAENIAWGYSTSGGIVGAWMSSAGHKSNIMGNYKDVGCSYKAPYWTCDFGRISPTAGSSATPSPTPTRALTATPTKTPASSPLATNVSTVTITQPPTPTGKPWWCAYAPSFKSCQ